MFELDSLGTYGSSSSSLLETHFRVKPGLTQLKLEVGYFRFETKKKIKEKELEDKKVKKDNIFIKI
jgi:hypothetical protein